jgi:hypothetical protein
LVFAKSMTASAPPFSTAFTMWRVKALAISMVMDGGIASSVRFTIASTRTGPSCVSARGDAGLDIGSVFGADAHGFGHGREIRMLELRAGVPESRGFLLELDESRCTVVEPTTFTGRSSCRRLNGSPVSMANPPSPESEITGGWDRPLAPRLPAPSR